MRVRTFLGILLALVVVVAVAFFTQQNIELLQRSFRLTAAYSVPLYAVLLAVFLLGFLPVVTMTVVATLRQDLARRRQRRFDREARSLRGSFRRAIDLKEDGQWNRAAAEFETVLAEQPEDFSTLLRYGEVLRKQGKIDQALDVHRRASVLYPQSVAVLYELAEDYEAKGSRDVAEQIRDRILRDFSGVGLRVRRHRRNAAIERQDWETADRLQEKVETLLQDHSEESEPTQEAIRRGLAYERGVRLLENDKPVEAKRAFEEILSQASAFVPARIMLGEALLLEGDPAAAVGEWQKGWETTGNPTYLQRIEDHFIERGEPLEALETLHRIIAGAHNDLLPRYFLGQLYARLEMHDEALKVLGSIRDRVHESPSLLYLMGRLHLRRGEQTRAMEAFVASIELADFAARKYRCDACSAQYRNWRAQCENCGTWDSVEFHFDVEPVGGEELSLHERPIWPVYDAE